MKYLAVPATSLASSDIMNTPRTLYRPSPSNGGASNAKAPARRLPWLAVLVAFFAGALLAALTRAQAGPGDLSLAPTRIVIEASGGEPSGTVLDGVDFILRAGEPDRFRADRAPRAPSAAGRRR